MIWDNSKIDMIDMSTMMIGDNSKIDMVNMRKTICHKPFGFLLMHFAFLDLNNDQLIYYRAQTKYDAKVMFSQFLYFCSQGRGGGRS